tara:strand:- start:281 stop:697 length:417 start_codon:yes stop_codon:yes gene_type:complete
MKHCIIKNITDTKVKMTVYTEKTSTSKITEFTSKNSTSNYFKRLRKDLHKCGDKVKIIDNINNITTEHNPVNSSIKNIRDINPRKVKEKKLRYIPDKLTTTEKSDNEIRQERIKSIMLDLELDNISSAEIKLRRYFDK